MIGVVQRLARTMGIEISSTNLHRKMPDVSEEIRAIIARSSPYTMTSPERLFAVCAAVEYAVGAGVPGAFVECGVWRGGSSMAAAETFLRLHRRDIDLFLFDTYEGMSAPTSNDRSIATGRTAEEMLAGEKKTAEVWAYAPFDDVRRNLASTGYPEDKIHFVKGMVENTVPAQAPDRISILRLDTDWYESTKHELIHLYPRLSPQGVLIIDDYGYWAGARKAVDEYFEEHPPRPLLFRIDATGRICVKQ